MLCKLIRPVYGIFLTDHDNNTMELLTEFIRVSLGTQSKLSKSPSIAEWDELFVMGQRQAIAGVLFTALDKLSNNNQKPPTELLFEWLGVYEQIRNTNRKINKCCLELSQHFLSHGIKTCILKGQGNALLYPDKYCRTPGDIDIWTDADKDIIRKLVRKKYPNVAECSWHIDYPFYPDTKVEVHYIPSYLRHPKYAKRLQAFYEEYKVMQFVHFVEMPESGGIIAVPTFEVNVIQQLSHVMRHYFVEGIGLRQIIDLFYLLSSNNEKNVDYQGLLSSLGLLKFSRAIMWILHEKMGLEKDKMIVPSDSKRGRSVYEDILRGGNWGRYDKRKHSLISNIYGMYPFVERALRQGILFPEEAVITPIYRRLL